MNNKKTYKISVGTADEFEDYIAEIHFPNKAGLILSQEDKAEGFQVSIHSFNVDALKNYDYCRNSADDKILLSDLIQALEYAVERLTTLEKSD